ncbi:MAG: zinc-ribbon protein [Glaciihabitans sp.]|nr:zinc-ribbon protein [Glaciihabitans sp.]
MFLLLGTRYTDTIINVVSFVCGFCGVHADQNVIKRANRFTLFFIPLFSISTSYVNVCTNCGGNTELTKDQAQHSLDWARNRGSA